MAQLRRDLAVPSDENVGDAARGGSVLAGAMMAARKASAVDGEPKAGGEGLKAGGGVPAGGARGLPTDAKPLVISVPYGADALAGSRLDLVRQLLDRLVKENHTGAVDIKSFPGRFCLVGNPNDGYSLAPDEILFSKCDVVGNPADDALLPAQRTPLPFVNLAGAARNSSHGAVTVQSSAGESTTTVAPYPQVSPELTAGEWNRAGSANNRVEIRVR